MSPSLRLKVVYPVTRHITYAEALREAQDYCLGAYPDAYLMGLGVSDPRGVFGSTLGLAERYGPERVVDIPIAENAGGEGSPRDDRVPGCERKEGKEPQMHTDAHR